MYALFLFLLLTGSVTAGERWFDRHSEGWFWYQQIQEPDEEAKSQTQVSPASLQPLTVPWIRQNIGQYLDRAIDHPSKENVSAYLYLDRLVKEKSELFARVGKQVIESDPMLDENVRRPISPAAAKIKDDMAHQAKEVVLKKVARIAGLVFYYQGSCKLCHLQAQSVLLMKQLYGFEVIPFSTDGILIPELPDSRVEKSPHPTLNIQAYPALYLMQPPDNIVLLRQGGVSLTELCERVISVSAEQHWISAKEYRETRVTHETGFTEPLPLNPLTSPTQSYDRSYDGNFK